MPALASIVTASLARRVIQSIIVSIATAVAVKAWMNFRYNPAI